MLPGLSFEDQPAALNERLPRMDIAVFVGFAQSGPIDLPVVCEDYARFEMIFGGLHELFPAASGDEMILAQLAPTVKSFFANSGRRCWVVRVARGARTARLPLSGLWHETSRGWRPVFAAARSPGRWGFELTAATRLEVRNLGQPGADSAWRSRLWSGELSAARPAPLSCEPAIGASLASGELLRFVTPPLDVSLYPRYRRLIAYGQLGKVETRAANRYVGHDRLPVEAARYFAAPRVLPAEGLADLFLPRWRRLAVSHLEVLADSSAGAACEARVRFSLTRPVQHLPQPGEPIRLRLTGPEGERLLIGSLRQVSQSASDPGRLEILAEVLEPVAAPGQPLEASRMEALGLELSTGHTGQTWRLSNLGFWARHPRALSALPDDSQLYGAPLPAEQTELWQEAAAPRLPLAGRLPRDSQSGRPTPVLPDDALPIGLDWRAASWLPAVQDRRDGLRRDGLLHQSDSLFLDPRLDGLHSDSLLARAEALRHSLPPGARLDPPLRGIHAALDIEEATLIAAADACLPEWTEICPPDPLPAEPGSPVEAPLAVCAASGEAFAGCVPLRLAPPTDLAVEPTESGQLRLTWGADPRASQFLLQWARRPDWSDATGLAETDQPAWSFALPAGQTRYLRVRISGADTFSDWSAGLAVGTPVSPGKQATSTDYRSSLRVQRALLRLCAARADLTAVLSAPWGADHAATLGHLAALRSFSDQLDAPFSLRPDEARALGYGAFYHPWLRLPERPGQRMASDGAAAGIIAARARSRGAWVAPANVALCDAAALLNSPSPAVAAALFDAGANLWRSDGMVLKEMGARTLSAEPDSLFLSVRRLMILLRRLLLRDGQSWVFEPNGPQLARSVERLLGAWLAELHARGAFAPGKPAEAWRLEVDHRDADQGRLVVTLAVAPSRPLEFLTVRLVREGERLMVLEEGR